MTDLSLRLYVGARTMISSMAGHLRRENGQDLIEYAVLVGAIGIALFTAMVVIGTGPFDDFAEKIGNCISLDPSCDG